MEGVSGQVHAPPPRNWKKMRLSEEIFTSFTYVLLIKLGGNRNTIHAKWKGVGGQVRVDGG